MDLTIPLCFVSLLLLGFSSAQDTEAAPELVVSPKDGAFTAKEGDGFALTCDVTGLPEGQQVDIQVFGPDKQLTQSSDSLQIDRSPQSVRLIFISLSSSHSGTYEFKAVLNGEEKSASFVLTVRSLIRVNSKPVQNPKINTDALIECNATSNPPPSVTWRYKENKITSGGRYVINPKQHGLTIKNITEADNGMYFCDLEIKAQGQFKRFKINVTVTIPPYRKSPMSHSDPIAGKPFKLDCDGDGTPKPVYTFYKFSASGNRVKLGEDGGRWKVDKYNGKLSTDKLEITDEGKYQCSMSNIGAIFNDELTIDVKVAPTIRAIKSISMEENNPAFLECQAEGDPAPTISWKKKGTDQPIIDDPAKGISIETSPGEENMVKEVTSKLKFDSLKAEHSGNYTCRGVNSAGNSEQTGSLTVEYKPKFDNQPYDQAWGWVNHETEIKCVVDAVPEASITWKHKDVDITAGGHFKITSVRGTPQTTSTLLVSVNPVNLDTIFGEYTCVAVNGIAPSSYAIQHRRASKPGQPQIKINDVTPTTVELLITPPGQDGGQPIKDYKIVYYKEGEPEKAITRIAEVSTDKDEPRTRHLIDSLFAQSLYLIFVEARTDVGYGDPYETSAETESIRKPDIPDVTSPRNGGKANSYTLTWKKPLSGGANITSYSIKYGQVEIIEGKEPWDVERVVGEMKTVEAKETQVEFNDLMPNAYYRVEIKAKNAIGPSDPKFYIFKTAPGGMPKSAIEQTGMTTGAIIGIIIAVLIILFIVIDVVFYFTKSCGLLWFLKGKVAGGDDDGDTNGAANADQMEKQAFLKEGKPDSEEPSAKENVDMVNETDKKEEMEPEEKPMEEFEPEDKPEEKPPAEPAEEVKEEAPTSSPQTDAAPATVTTPQGEGDSSVDPKV